nr:hypothetical protein A8713_033250 [Streptomyces sp. SAT1]
MSGPSHPAGSKVSADRPALSAEAIRPVGPDSVTGARASGLSPSGRAVRDTWAGRARAVVRR